MTEYVKFQCNIPQYLKDEIINIAKDKEKSLGSFVQELVEVYKKSVFLIDNPDLKRACTIKNFTAEQVINEALRDYTKRAINAEKKGLTSHTSSAKADQHIASIVDLIIESNNKAEDINDIIYINQTSITKWLRNNNIPLMNFNVIQRYLRLNKDLLEEHHKKHNITATHNRDVFMAKRKTIVQ